MEDCHIPKFRKNNRFLHIYMRSSIKIFEITLKCYKTKALDRISRTFIIIL